MRQTQPAKIIVNFFLIIFLLAYPFGIYFGLQIFNIKLLALFFLAIIFLRFLLTTNQQPTKQDKLSSLQAKAVLLFAVVIFLLVQIFNHEIFFKFYPVFMNLIFLISFAYTLKNKPSMIERFARLRHADLSLEAIDYLAKVTKVWCLFFVINGLISLYTVLFSSFAVWTLYNGFISYLLIAILFIIEFIVRLLFINDQKKRL